MKKLDMFGTLMLIVGNLLLIACMGILLSIDFRVELFHMVVFITGIVGSTTTILSYVIALIVGTSKEINYEEHEE